MIIEPYLIFYSFAKAMIHGVFIWIPAKGMAWYFPRVADALHLLGETAEEITSGFSFVLLWDFILGILYIILITGPVIFMGICFFAVIAEGFIKAKSLSVEMFKDASLWGIVLNVLLLFIFISQLGAVCVSLFSIFGANSNSEFAFDLYHIGRLTLHLILFSASIYIVNVVQSATIK